MVATYRGVSYKPARPAVGQYKAATVLTYRGVTYKKTESYV